MQILYLNQIWLNIIAAFTMAKILTNVGNVEESDINVRLLTDDVSSSLKFYILFGPDMHKDYCISKLNAPEYKKLGNFLKSYVNKDMKFVESKERKLDKNDTWDDLQVVHYEFGKPGRIHGYYANGVFNVIRIDPFHKYHK